MIDPMEILGIADALENGGWNVAAVKVRAYVGESHGRIAHFKVALRQVRDFEPVTNGDYAVMYAIPALRKIAIIGLIGGKLM